MESCLRMWPWVLLLGLELLLLPLVAAGMLPRDLLSVRMLPLLLLALRARMLPPPTTLLGMLPLFCLRHLLCLPCPGECSLPLLGLL